MSDHVSDDGHYVDTLRLITDPEGARAHLRSYRHRGHNTGGIADPVTEHAADHRDRADDLDHVHEPDFPPPPTEDALADFVGDLDGATDWPEAPVKPGVDVPYSMRLVPAETLQAGDLIHDARTFVRVVTVYPPEVPILVRGADGDSWLAHRTVGEHVLASRLSGWDDESKHWPKQADTADQAVVDQAPAWEGGGPSRAELLAGIRRPRASEPAEEPADGR